MLAMTATEPPPGTSRDRVEVEDSLRERVAEAVTGAWQSAIAGGSLPPLPDDERSQVDVHVERPAHPEHGDFATNLAMKLARPYRRSPMAIAQALAAELEGQIGREVGRTQLADLITSVEVAPPGFLDFRLSERATLSATRAQPHQVHPRTPLFRALGDRRSQARSCSFALAFLALREREPAPRFGRPRHPVNRSPGLGRRLPPSI